MADTLRVTVWNEYRHEKREEEVAKIYTDGIHGALADALREDGANEVQTATLDEPEHGLTYEVLEATDVLLWWGHIAHGEVSDELVERIHQWVLGGMGLVVLHLGPSRRSSRASWARPATSSGATMTRKGSGSSPRAIR